MASQQKKCQCGQRLQEDQNSSRLRNIFIVSVVVLVLAAALKFRSNVAKVKFCKKKIGFKTFDLVGGVLEIPRDNAEITEVFSLPL